MAYQNTGSRQIRSQLDQERLTMTKKKPKPGEPGFVSPMDAQVPPPAEVWGNPDPALAARVKAEHAALQWGSPNPSLARPSGGGGGMIGNVAAALGGAVAGGQPSVGLQGYQGSPPPRPGTPTGGPITQYDTATGAFKPYQPPQAPPAIAAGTPAQLGMGDVRMADQRMRVDLPPPVQQRQQQNPNSDLPPRPINLRMAQQDARGDYMGALHSDRAGPLGSPESRARIQDIRDKRDVVHAYARANRPLQTVQSPGEIQNRHSELGRNLVSGFRTELEGIDQQINAVQNEPLSEDKQRRLDVLVAQRANKAAQLQKAVNDPYWQQYTPERAGQIAEGQRTLRDRQMSDRTSGAADVAAYQGRQQYDRNLEDTIRQRGVAEELAASKANEAESVARGANAGRQALGTGADQIVAQDAADQAAHVAEINKINRPVELDAAKVDAQKQQHPEWQAAAQGVLSGIKTASGKMLNGDTKAAYSGMVNAFTTFQSLPPELQRSAAASIMSELAADGLDIPKEAFADDRFNNVVSWLMDNTSPLGLGASALGYGSRKPTETAQDTINSVLKLLRTAQSSP